MTLDQKARQAIHRLRDTLDDINDPEFDLSHLVRQLNQMDDQARLLRDTLKDQEVD